jgi:hypothetical protein
LNFISKIRDRAIELLETEVKANFGNINRLGGSLGSAIENSEWNWSGDGIRYPHRRRRQRLEAENVVTRGPRAIKAVSIFEYVEIAITWELDFGFGGKSGENVGDFPNRTCSTESERNSTFGCDNIK